MMRALILTVCIFVVLVLSASRVSACSCDPPKPRKLFREARAVFVGEVVDIRESTVPLGKGFPSSSYAVTFKISKYWKGVKGANITVYSDLGGLECHQFAYRKGETYFVYAFGKDLISITGCTRSGQIDAEHVIEQLKLFGKGRVPRPPHNKVLQLPARQHASQVIFFFSSA
jgi:hypothetical protein